jgi:glycosyltransferase involved in cell wall biosynthesis
MMNYAYDSDSGESSCKESIDIIVPVYNEEASLGTFLERIRNIPLKFNLIFVDNGSTDRTIEILQGSNDITIIRHEKNEGYGASIVDGISNSRGEIIIIIDADCEYPPESIPDLVTRLEESSVVYASRFLRKTDICIPWMKRVGNMVVTRSFNLLFSQEISDLYTGCKALRRSALEGITLDRKGFEHVLEMSAKLSGKGIAIDEIFVHFEPRQAGYSKMRHVSETLKFFFLLFLYRLRTRVSVRGQQTKREGL